MLNTRWPALFLESNFAPWLISTTTVSSRSHSIVRAPSFTRTAFLLGGPPRWGWKALRSATPLSSSALTAGSGEGGREVDGTWLPAAAEPPLVLLLLLLPSAPSPPRVAPSAPAPIMPMLLRRTVGDMSWSVGGSAELEGGAVTFTCSCVDGRDGCVVKGVAVEASRSVPETARGAPTDPEVGRGTTASPGSSWESSS